MGPDTTESEIRNRFPASGDCESTQIGRTPTNIGDFEIARGTLAATSDSKYIADIIEDRVPDARSIFALVNRRRATLHQHYPAWIHFVISIALGYCAWLA